MSDEPRRAAVCVKISIAAKNRLDAIRNHLRALGGRATFGRMLETLLLYCRNTEKAAKMLLRMQKEVSGDAESAKKKEVDPDV